MVDPPVGYRFHPTDEEIVGVYVRPKNLESNTSHVDKVMNTVDIYESEPWELPCKSRIKSTDEVWYFVGCNKKNQQQMHNNKQSRRTKSGFWSKTGLTTEITRKRGGGDGEKIGEKRVFVFKYSKISVGSKSKSKSDWVMHEYVATFSSPDSPNQTMMMMMPYTVCKVIFKGDPRDLPSSSSGASEIDRDLSLIPHVDSSLGRLLSTETENPHQITTISSAPHVNNNNYSGGLVTETEVENPPQITSTIFLTPHVNNNNPGGLITAAEVVGHFTTQESSFQLQDPHLFSGFLYLEEDARFEDATLRDLNYDDAEEEEEEEEHVNLWLMQEDRNDHRPKMSLTGFISDDDDSDSDSVYATTTCSIKSSSTCVSFGSSNPPCLTQEVNEALGTNSVIISENKMSPCDDDAQVIEIGGSDQKGQEMVIKNKRAGFIYRMIQKFAKKIKLCSCVSRI